ncbi:MAG: 3-dehydroquinate synthase [Brevinematia bacterium]
MIKLTVEIPRETLFSYPIYIGRETLKFLVEEINKLSPSQIVIITDTTVSSLHLPKVEYQLSILNLPTLKIVVPSGEKSKSRKMKERIENQMLKSKVDRKAVILAFGGGVIGDLAGFVSATYHRGINFIQLPTTLLAMVDSSIGGKVGIDTPYGKNTIGAFHQPRAVVSELMFLDTLPEEHFKNGLAEILKHSIIKDEEFYKFLLENSEGVKNKDAEILSKVIEWSCRIKKEIVESDEREEGLRKILNFGHTIGHAIELLSNFRILHGLAVSVGMILEAFISLKIGILPKEEYEKIVSLISKFELPISLREIGLKGTQKVFERMIEFMKGDKKSVYREIKMSLPKKIGKMTDSFVVTVEPSVIMKSLKEINAL